MPPPPARPVGMFSSLWNHHTPQKVVCDATSLTWATPYLGSSSLFKSLLMGLASKVLSCIIPGSDFRCSSWRPSRADVLSQVYVFSGRNLGHVKLSPCRHVQTRKPWDVSPRVTASEWRSRAWAQVSGPVPFSLWDLILNFQWSEIENPEDSSWAYVLRSKTWYIEAFLSFPNLH